MSTIIDNDVYLITNLKALLQEKLWLLESRLQQKRATTRYKQLTESEARVLAAIRGEELLTISEIARRMGVSRQAIHKIVSGLVKAKLIKLEPIPGNARDKSIGFTRDGKNLKKEAGKILRELEKEVENSIGTKNFNLLKELLSQPW